VNSVEDALIRRIDARRAIASGLQGRQRARSIFRGYWLGGHTLKELGEQHSLSPERVRQIAFKALERVQTKLRIPPQRISLAEVKASFDRAAFLRHMRLLIVRREQERVEAKEREWQREMQVMGHFLDMATPKAPPPPPPQPDPQQAYAEHAAALQQLAAATARQNAVQQRRQQELNEAKAVWSGADPAFASQQYFLMGVAFSTVFSGIRLEAGRSYWVPWSIAITLRG
jgi:hypothetical protein